MDENVHRSAYVKCFCGNKHAAFLISALNFAVNYGTIGSKTPKISRKPCTAERQATPMTSFFCDVIRLQSVLRSSNNSIKGHFTGFGKI